jgi:predicted flap endonuclease-1-like 5' DNA nuclease
MEEEAVDGAIMALVEDTGAISEDIDVTIYTAIGNDQTTGETYAAVVAIASEVKPEPSQKKPAKKTATTAKKPRGKKDATSREARPADLQKIEGIGPKIAELLIQNGILDLADLAQTPAERIREILAAGGTRFNRADPTTWAEQAALGAAGDWDKLQALQARLTAGR